MSDDRNIDTEQDVEGHELFAGGEARKDLSPEKNLLDGIDYRRDNDDDVEGHALSPLEGRRDLTPDKNALVDME